MMLLIGFAASNIVVGLSSSYAVLITFRIVGGICAGVMWPMIAAYGTRLVPVNMHGKAITVIMSGNTLGISIGLPAMKTIGLNHNDATSRYFVSTSPRQVYIPQTLIC